MEGKICLFRNRIVVAGRMNSGYDLGYITRFPLEAIAAHPDFQTLIVWTMDLLSSGTENINTETLQSIGSATTQTVTITVDTDQGLVYVPLSPYTSEVYFQASSQSYAYNKNVNVQISPDVSCSSTGSTTISFSLTVYNGNAVPSWVSVDSVSGALTMATPNLSVNTDFPFYLSATLSGFSNPVNKLITITVQGACSASNCQICSTTDSSV